MLRRGLLVVLLSLGQTVIANAQSPPTGASDAPPQESSARSLRDGLADVAVATGKVQTDRTPAAAPRACDACPQRRPGTALLETTGVNIAYGMVNLLRGQVTARITPASWWHNVTGGWVWDLDEFVVNQLGHPYQGSNYFTAGRANGLGFYESAGIAAFGSGTWEYFGETNRPSLNDFINTTFGGIAMGEMAHRAGWLIRDTRVTGRARLWREIAAAAVDPLSGLNRVVSGDVSRVSEKPAHFVPSSQGGFVSSGVLWRGASAESDESGADPFLQIDLLYGDTERGRSHTPYEAFNVRLTAGGGGAISEARVRGRLLGMPFHDDRWQFSLIQSYTFLGNRAYQFGAQSFEARLGGTTELSPRSSLALLGWGGVTLLGAVDSRPFNPPATSLPQQGSTGQGVSDEPRRYDYGPGWTFGASATVSRGGHEVVTTVYEGRSVYSLDGIRANHLLQRVRADVVVPVGNRLGIGVAGEYFGRFSLYQDPRRTRRAYRYPQFRAFLAWSLP